MRNFGLCTTYLSTVENLNTCLKCMAIVCSTYLLGNIEVETS